MLHIDLWLTLQLGIFKTKCSSWVNKRTRMLWHNEITYTQVLTDRTVCQPVISEKANQVRAEAALGTTRRCRVVAPGGEAEALSGRLHGVNMAVLLQSVFESFIFVSLTLTANFDSPRSNKEREVYFFYKERCYGPSLIPSSGNDWNDLTVCKQIIDIIKNY